MNEKEKKQDHKLLPIVVHSSEAVEECQHKRRWGSIPLREVEELFLRLVSCRYRMILLLEGSTTNYYTSSVWLDMRSSLSLSLMTILFLAPATLAKYDCEDLPNVYTVEDLSAIEVDCKDAKLLASKIYPSATWIIHDYLGTGDFGIPSKWLTGNKKTLRNICIVWLGGKGSLSADKTFPSVSGNCGGSYPIDYADDYNFIDFTCAFSDDKKQFNHSLVQDGQEVLNEDPYILLVQTADERDDDSESVFTGYQAAYNTAETKESRELNIGKYEKRMFDHNPNATGKFVQCPGWGIRDSSQLQACSSIVGPMFYNKSFYGMEDLAEKPFHHGCFTVENHDSLKDLDFLDKLKTGSDYVDKCIGKFANVVRNNPNLCPDPRKYYASMDPNPESLIRTAYLNSVWNKKGNMEVKVEFPEGKTFECVNECSGPTIDDAHAHVDPKGLYEFPCKIFAGNVTLMNDEWKETQKAQILQHIREIKGYLKINADVDRDVLPQLRFVGGPNVKGPALELTLTGLDGYDPVLPMRLAKVTVESGKSIVLRHLMEFNKIPANLIADLERSAGGKEKIDYQPISHKHFFF